MEEEREGGGIKIPGHARITSFINFGQRSLIILNFGLAVKAQAVPNEHKIRMRIRIRILLPASVDCSYVCVWVCELVHIPVQINVSFGLLITVRARAINLITLSAPAPPRLAFPH